MSRITVIVTEDEAIILNNIVKKVENSGENIQVIGKALNGKETLALIQKEIPDILITDIEMPGMNGLELIQAVKCTYPQIHVIIISGYSNFEYAQTAIKYGVDDYILKPVSASDLKLLLGKISELIIIEKHQAQRNVLSLTLAGNPLEQTSPSQFTDGHFLLIFITLGNLPSRHTDAQYSPDILRYWTQINLTDCFTSNSDLDHFWIIDETYPLQKFIIIHTLEQPVRANYIVLQLYNYFKNEIPGFPFHILISSNAIGYHEIWNTARAMRSSLSEYVTMFTQDYAVLPITDNAAPAKQNQPKIPHQAHPVDFVYQLHNSNSFCTYVLHTLREYTTQKYPQAIVETFLREVFPAVSSLFQVNQKSAITSMNLVLSKMYSYRNIEELCNNTLTVIRNLLQEYSQETNSDSLYDKLKLYLEYHYNERISLDDLSNRYGYTPSYINRIFKKECGQSPLQYLTSLRIKRAQKLLEENSNVDIRVIASSIGYDDARYFSRVFKSETGVTPSEWMKQNLDLA